MAELADALASGASVFTDVQVQPLSRAPKKGKQKSKIYFGFFEATIDTLTDAASVAPSDFTRLSVEALNLFKINFFDCLF